VPAAGSETGYVEPSAHSQIGAIDPKPSCGDALLDHMEANNGFRRDRYPDQQCRCIWSGSLDLLIAIEKNGLGPFLDW